MAGGIGRHPLHRVFLVDSETKKIVSIEEIQRVLRVICLERRGAHPKESFKLAPNRMTLTFANFSFEEQEQIEGYAEMMIAEAHALCMRLQARCPILREGDNGELWDLERVYKAQYHAMARLRRRCDEGLWIRAHIREARRWLEEAYVQSVN
jgi:hypothetical protein